jgi:dephospho-CoA kinase
VKTKPIIGLIGGIGSGKSSVAAILAQRGARVISGDKLGHEALQQPEIQSQVVQRWGTGLLDAQRRIDRRRLAGIVFGDSAERHALEKLVFPWIERRLKEEVVAAKADANVALIIVDAAIMLEAGWYEVCDFLVYVDAPREVRWQRAAQERGWTQEDVKAREEAQMPLAEKKCRADFLLDNSGSWEKITTQVDDLLGRWGVIAKGSPSRTSS